MHLGRRSRLQRSSASIGPLVTDCRPSRRLARDPRRRRRIERRHRGSGRRRPARASSAIRTTKATARRSRPASARPPATFVLIVDADGQHQPADAARLVAQPRRVRSRRRRAIGAIAGDAGPRRVGNALLNWIAGYLAERPIPDLTSGFRAARRECLLEFLHLLPNGFSTPTTTTLAFLKAGYSVRFEPIEAPRRAGRLEDQARLGRRRVLPDPAEGDHDLQPAADLPADQRCGSFVVGAAMPCGRSRRSRTSPIRRCC